MNDLEAFGITENGFRIDLNTSARWIIAIGRGYVSLEVPDGLRRLECHGNHLKTLDVPSSVRTLYCDKELFDYDTCKVNNVRIFYG